MNYTKGGFPIWDDDFDKEHFTPEEIAESDMRVSLITATIKQGNDTGVVPYGALTSPDVITTREYPQTVGATPRGRPRQRRAQPHPRD